MMTKSKRAKITRPGAARAGNAITSKVRASDPNLGKATPPATATEAGIAELRGRTAPFVAMPATGPDARATPSMRRRSRKGDPSMPRPDGGVGGAVMD